MSFPVPIGACRKAGQTLSVNTFSDRTRDNGFKLKEGKFRLDARKKFVSLRVIRQT